MIANKIITSLLKSSRVILLTSFCLTILATPFEFFLYVSIPLYFVYFIFTKQYKKIILEKTDFILISFLLITIISAVIAGHRLDAFEGAAVFLIYFIVYFYFKNLEIDSPFYDQLLRAIALSTIIWCGFALFHYYIIKKEIIIMIAGKKIISILSIHPWLTGNPIISILQHPALGGNLIAVILTFIISFIAVRFKSLNLADKILFILAFLVSSYTVVLTYTRSAWIFIAVVLIISVLFTKKYKIFSFILLAGIILAFLPNEKIRSTLKNPLNSPNVAGRILQYKAGMEIFSKSNILFGTGLLNFQYDFTRYYSNDMNYENVPFIHNNYIAVLVETGILGFLSFFGFLIFTLVLLIKENYKNWSAARLNAAVFICGFLVNSLFDALMYSVPIALFLWIAAGLALNKRTGNETLAEYKLKSK